MSSRTQHNSRPQSHSRSSSPHRLDMLAYFGADASDAIEPIDVGDIANMMVNFSGTYIPPDDMQELQDYIDNEMDDYDYEDEDEDEDDDDEDDADDECEDEEEEDGVLYIKRKKKVTVNWSSWSGVYQHLYKDHLELVVPGRKANIISTIRGALRHAFDSKTEIQHGALTHTPLLIAPTTQHPAPHGIIPHIILTTEEDPLNDTFRRGLEEHAIPWSPPNTGYAPQGPTRRGAYIYAGLRFEPLMELDWEHRGGEMASWFVAKAGAGMILGEGQKEEPWTLDRLPKIFVQTLKANNRLLDQLRPNLRIETQNQYSLSPITSTSQKVNKAGRASIDANLDSLNLAEDEEDGSSLASTLATSKARWVSGSSVLFEASDSGMVAEDDEDDDSSIECGSSMMYPGTPALSDGPSSASLTSPMSPTSTMGHDYGVKVSIVAVDHHELENDHEIDQSQSAAPTASGPNIATTNKDAAGTNTSTISEPGSAAVRWYDANDTIAMLERLCFENDPVARKAMAEGMGLTDEELDFVLMG